MRPVSPSFISAVRGAHKAVFSAKLCSPGQTGVTPTGTDLLLSTGNVVFDTGADVNGTLDITVNATWGSILPYGSEIFVQRGVQYANGIQEFVGLGYFRVNSVEQDNPSSSILRITGEDRMSNIRDGRTTGPVQFGSGSSVGAIIDFLIQDVMPSVTTIYDADWDSGSAYTTLINTDHFLDQDRLKFLQELLDAYGKVGYFDYAGRFTVKTAPSPTGPSVFDINAGQDGVMVSADREISRDSVYNGVVASGEPVDTNQKPVLGLYLDTDPASPTYWYGPFGKVPRFFSSPFLQTNEQCVATARKLFFANRGLPYSVTLEAAPNPALEGWDVVNVVYPGGNNEAHILTRLEYPLSVTGAMPLETRKQFLN